MKYKTRIFGAAEKGEDCVAGHLNTRHPIEVGHRCKINGHWWICWRLGVNCDNEALADLHREDYDLLTIREVNTKKFVASLTGDS